MTVDAAVFHLLASVICSQNGGQAHTASILKTRFCRVILFWRLRYLAVAIPLKEFVLCVARHISLSQVRRIVRKYAALRESAKLTAADSNGADAKQNGKSVTNLAEKNRCLCGFQAHVLRMGILCINTLYFGSKSVTQPHFGSS